MFYLFSVMDELTGGAMKRGWRDANKAEQIAEWDALPPEQLQQLRQIKGDAWINSYGAEMERIRKELDGVKQHAVALQPQ